MVILGPPLVQAEAPSGRSGDSVLVFVPHRRVRVNKGGNSCTKKIIIFPQLGFALGVLTYLVKDCCDVSGYSPDPRVPRRGAPEEP